jgi:hypothetical protein
MDVTQVHRQTTPQTVYLVPTPETPAAAKSADTQNGPFVTITADASDAGMVAGPSGVLFRPGVVNPYGTPSSTPPTQTRTYDKGSFFAAAQQNPQPTVSAPLSNSAEFTLIAQLAAVKTSTASTTTPSVSTDTKAFLARVAALANEAVTLLDGTSTTSSTSDTSGSSGTSTTAATSGKSSTSGTSSTSSTSAKPNTSDTSSTSEPSGTSDISRDQIKSVDVTA